MAGNILILVGASIILYCSWATLRIKPGRGRHQFLERIRTFLGALKESIRDFLSMRVLEQVSVPLPHRLLYFSYRQYQKSGLRLFVGIRDIEGTRFQELNIVSIIRLKEFLDHMNEMHEIDIPFTNGKLMRLRRDDNLYPWNPYPWLKVSKNVASQRKCFPLFISLEGSGNENLVEVPIAAAELIVNALDGFLSLAGVRHKY